MRQDFRIILLLLLLGSGLVYLGGFNDYFHPAKKFSLKSPEFERLRVQADKGSQKECDDVAKIYDYHEKYAESIKYWECGIDKTDVYKSVGMRHLAGYHFHGFGVDVNPVKGTMYLIISENTTWPQSKVKKLKPWLGHIPYADVSDIGDIEKKFEEGAELARKYIKDNNITDPRLTEDKLDESLKRHLKSLEKINRTILIRHWIFFLTLFFLLIGIIQWVLKNRAGKL